MDGRSCCRWDVSFVVNTHINHPTTILTVFFRVVLRLKIPWWTGQRQLTDLEGRSTHFPTYQDVLGLHTMCRNLQLCDDFNVNPFSNEGIRHSFVIFLLVHFQVEIFKSKVFDFLCFCSIVFLTFLCNGRIFNMLAS